MCRYDPSSWSELCLNVMSLMLHVYFKKIAKMEKTWPPIMY